MPELANDGALPPEEVLQLGHRHLVRQLLLLQRLGQLLVQLVLGQVQRGRRGGVLVGQAAAAVNPGKKCFVSSGFATTWETERRLLGIYQMIDICDLPR